ncbi:energy transducer TonB [Billgrantia gudaonensis]|uniref:Protein TonB n=1 Tax=Billgrantia gudaonensis TaxID=376427 RepID=A0A1G8NDL8_9GAMM|nr:energy transducer TonB [Halomonas gudaonensis]SDI78258.1 protein TonB [Halomonas gudaonensis]
MIRPPVAMVGGVMLALGLFWLLALLVAPPQADIEVLEPTTLDLVEAEAPAEQMPAEAAPPPPTPAAPVEPPPVPEPAPLSESRIALPDPELPTSETPPMELDDSLPELVEQRPEPRPEPEPQPEPEPAPQPEPASEAVEATTDETAVAERASDASETSREPVDVGSPTPTSRVPPDYPARAQRRGMEGHVELTFVIRPDGSVDPDTIRIVEAQPGNVFDRAARQAVARWQFEPGEGLRRARQRLEFQLR